MSLLGFLTLRVNAKSLRKATLAAVGSVGFFYLAGCAQKGDFGRPQESAFVDTLTEELNILFYEDAFVTGDIDGKGRYTGPKFSLTPNEIELRDIALHFHQPMTSDNTRLFHSRTAAAYAENLTRKRHIYGPARTKTILAHIDADHKWLERFNKVAPKIKFADQKREHALRVKNLMLTNRDRIRTVSRIKENNQVIHKIFQDLQQRIINYEYAIERSRLETPDGDVEKVGTALSLFREKVILAQTEYDKMIRELAKRKTQQLQKALERARRERAIRMKKAKGATGLKPKKPMSHNKYNTLKPEEMNGQVEAKFLEPLQMPSMGWGAKVKQNKKAIRKPFPRQNTQDNAHVLK